MTRKGISCFEKNRRAHHEKVEIQDEPIYMVEQQFISPSDEYIYGTGQFQDGYLNIRGLTRRLTQVNSQISIPFILSNKGYGLLWNNYGLTDFNPADSSILLVSAKDEGETFMVNATSTSRKPTRNSKPELFTAIFDVPEDGDYSLLLDVGRTMASKYYVSIDGKNLVDLR